MRGILLDWLVEVTEEYEMTSDTYYLAKNFIDRFLSKQVVARAELQLVGVAAMMISSKMEEVEVPPAAEDYVYLCESTYRKEDIIGMEIKMLKVLEYNLAAPTEKTFLRRYQRAAGASLNDQPTLHNVAILSNYLTEITTLDSAFLKYPPSMIAASAVVIALDACECRPWTPTLEYYTQYRWNELQACMEAVVAAYRNLSPTLPAVKNKFASPAYLSISRRVFPIRVPQLQR